MSENAGYHGNGHVRIKTELLEVEVDPSSYNDILASASYSSSDDGDNAKLGGGGDHLNTEEDEEGSLHSGAEEEELMVDTTLPLVSTVTVTPSRPLRKVALAVSYIESEYQDEMDETEAIVNDSELEGNGIGGNGNQSSSVSKLKKVKPAICSLCNKGFPNADMYELHMRQVHRDERPYPCRHCGKPFAKSNERIKHETIHDPNRYKGPPKYPCTICGKRYHVKGSMEIHRKIAHFGYKAPRRDYKTKPVTEHHSKSGVKNPYLHLNRKPKQVYPCPHCDRNFDWRSQLEKHMFSHSSEKKFSCKICGQPFTFKTSLQTHLRRVHTTEKTPAGNHHPRPKFLNGQPCPCEICGKDMKTLNRLRVHMYLHTGEKPHECPTCGERYRMKGNLNHHIKRNHRPDLASNPIKQFKCLICGKEDMPFYGDLRRHRITHHDHIPYDAEKEKGFACGICEKPYFIRENAMICALLRHDPSNLLKEMFKFKCPECPPETFGHRSLALLRTHWQDEHPDKFLPVEFRRKGYSGNAKNTEEQDETDALPTASVNRTQLLDWKTNGIPEDLIKSEEPLYIELPLLSIPDEDRFLKREKWRASGSSSPSRKRTSQGERRYGIGKFECHICGKKVANSGNLRRHLDVVHHLPQGPVQIRLRRAPGNKSSSALYQCSVCDQRFWKKQTLRTHEKIHAGGGVGQGQFQGQVIRKVGRPRKSALDPNGVVIKQEPGDPESGSEYYGGPGETVPESKRFNCRFCRRKLINLRALRMHELRTHIKPWSTSRNKSKSLKKNSKSSDDDGGDGGGCDFDDVSSEHYFVVDVKKTELPGSSIVYEDNSYNGSGSHRNHRQINSNSVPESNDFNCNFCERKLMNLRALRIHELRAHIKPWSTARNKSKPLTENTSPPVNYAPIKIENLNSDDDSSDYDDVSSEHYFVLDVSKPVLPVKIENDNGSYDDDDDGSGGHSSHDNEKKYEEIRRKILGNRRCKLVLEKVDQFL